MSIEMPKTNITFQFLEKIGSGIVGFSIKSYADSDNDVKNFCKTFSNAIIKNDISIIDNQLVFINTTSKILKLSIVCNPKDLIKINQLFSTGKNEVTVFPLKESAFGLVVNEMAKTKQTIESSKTKH